MALPTHLARYQSLLDLLVEAALRDMEADTAPAEADDTRPPAAPAHAPEAEGAA